MIFSLSIIRPNIVDLIINEVLKREDSIKIIDQYSFAQSDKLSDHINSNQTQVLGIKLENGLGYDYNIVSTDLRVKVLEEYFRSINSPLEPYASVFIRKADKYNFKRWSLLPAIATVETSSCKTENFRGFKIRNCWGWRSNGRDIIFSSWDDAVDNILRNLSKWSTDPYVMQRSYCPPCEASGENRWANGVASEMKKMNEIAKKYGVESVTIRGK